MTWDSSENGYPSTEEVPSQVPHFASTSDERDGDAASIDDKTLERELRRKAVLYRLRGALGFLLYSGLIGFSFISLYVLIIDTSRFPELGSNWYERNFPIGLWIILGILIAVFIRNVAEFIYHLINWGFDTRDAEKLLEVETVLAGFTGVFRQYVRTRKIGMYAYIWVIWGFVAAALNLFEYYALLWQDIVFTRLVGAIILFSLLNLILGYQISGRFRIGGILVDHLRKIAYRSANVADVNPEVNADKNTRRHLEKFKREKYWWFY